MACEGATRPFAAGSWPAARGPGAESPGGQPQCRLLRFGQAEQERASLREDT